MFSKVSIVMVYMVLCHRMTRPLPNSIVFDTVSINNIPLPSHVQVAVKWVWSICIHNHDMWYSIRTIALICGCLICIINKLELVQTMAWLQTNFRHYASQWQTNPMSRISVTKLRNELNHMIIRYSPVWCCQAGINAENKPRSASWQRMPS